MVLAGLGCPNGCEFCVTSAFYQRKKVRVCSAESLYTEMRERVLESGNLSGGVFTIFDEEEKVLEAIKAGASGYLLKGAEADKVVESIKDVHSGGSVIQPNLARSLLRHFRMPFDKNAEPGQPGALPAESRQGLRDQFGALHCVQCVR